MIETKTWHALENQAVRLCHAGDSAGAITNLEQAIALIRDDAHLASETATMLNYLAGIYLSEGMLNEAEATIREALRRTGSEPMDYADNLLILAEVMHKQGRQRETIEAANEGLRLVRKEYGRDHDYTAGIEKFVQQFMPVPK